uniref:Putative salivary sulfotransferase n=1 Tax=Amblyomma sculptum TaxID=1581419 RepID=A0A1E1XRB5_AMBSC
MEADRPKPSYQIIDGVPRCPLANPDALRRTLSFVARKDDLVQVSFPKSGTHWVQYITQLILNEGEPISSYEDFTKGAMFIEYREDAMDYTASTPLRTLCTHLPPRRETLNPEAKYIYVARNPWDVSVSLYHQVKDLSVYCFDGTFNDFLEAFLTGDLPYGDYFEHMTAGYSLRQEPNVLFVTYEELKRDKRGAILRLAHFIGERYGNMLEGDSEESRKRLELILDRSTAENMRSIMVLNLSDHPDPLVDKLLKDKNMTSKAAYEGDPKRHNFVRKAIVGGWKEHFSPEQLRCFEATIAEKTQESDIMNLWSDIRQEALQLCAPLD